MDKETTLFVFWFVIGFEVGWATLGVIALLILRRERKRPESAE